MTMSDERREKLPDPRTDDMLTLYPHGGEREWSTVMHDEWKRDLGVEVVPRSLSGLASILQGLDEEDRRKLIAAMADAFPEYGTNEECAADALAALSELGGQP